MWRIIAKPLLTLGRLLPLRLAHDVEIRTKQSIKQSACPNVSRQPTKLSSKRCCGAEVTFSGRLRAKDCDQVIVEPSITQAPLRNLLREVLSASGPEVQHPVHTSQR